MTTTTLGYPRIGAHRELKFVTEEYWAGRVGEEELQSTASTLRRAVWTELRDSGLGTIPSNTFSFYDHVLDTSVMVDAVPDRYRALSGLERYFAMARGTADIPALEMTKWFDTNYHYIVPELSLDARFRLADGAQAKPVAEYLEAKTLGVETRPVLVGPLTYLLLAKAAPGSPEGFVPLDLLGALVEVYAELLERLAGAGAQWVQLDEPALAGDLGAREVEALERAYRRLGGLSSRPKILLATYFGTVAAEALKVVASTAVEAIGLDFVTRPDTLEVAASARRSRVSYRAAATSAVASVSRTSRAVLCVRSCASRSPAATASASARVSSPSRAARRSPCSAAAWRSQSASARSVSRSARA
ncbi:hypothetical protein [Streptosporangium sp. NPDC003464]